MGGVPIANRHFGKNALSTLFGRSISSRRAKGVDAAFVDVTIDSLFVQQSDQNDGAV